MKFVDVEEAGVRHDLLVLNDSRQLTGHRHTWTDSNAGAKPLQTIIDTVSHTHTHTHTRTVMWKCCKDRLCKSMGKPEIWPLATLKLIFTKFGICDYVVDTYTYAEFHHCLSRGGFPRICEIVWTRLPVLFFVGSSNSTPSRPPSPIFMHKTVMRHAKICLFSVRIMKIDI